MKKPSISLSDKLAQNNFESMSRDRDIERPVWRSEQLFGSCKEIVIVHDMQEYRLRITKSNKLILNK
jgi:hemin uptake protein HemP